MVEQNEAENLPPGERTAHESIKKEEKDDEDLDAFAKRWADIDYLIRKPFCCK
ncbi:MAG: hypothetical protein JW839_13570 [Candidatus Lokiarchaeota archaeon]|nr:hypothetical protein [Candidatus Lokiarchaeota archaeon]